MQTLHTNIENWDDHAERWIAAAAPTRMVHLGDLPDDVRQRHAALSPLWLNLWWFCHEEAQTSQVEKDGNTTFEKLWLDCRGKTKPR
ncbi:hypothetical protein ACOBV8_19510 (plasmid) [Pseudoalteromonas espejiana]